MEDREQLQKCLQDRFTLTNKKYDRLEKYIKTGLHMKGLSHDQKRVTRKQAENFIWEESTSELFYIGNKDKNLKKKLIRTSEQLLEIIHNAHCSTSGLHYGVKATFKNASRCYYYQGLYREIINYINACEKCSTNSVRLSHMQAVKNGVKMEKHADSTPDISHDSLVSASSQDPEQEKILLAPFTYILQAPGKMVRSKLAEAFNHWMKIPEDKLKAISDIIFMLHNSSLLIDDIEDNSTLRRGIPVAHNIHGIASTINSANYAYFLGLEKCLALGHSYAPHVFCEQLLELHRGQGMEIYWRDSFTCPTENEYKDMTIKKTGGLFGLAIRLMQLFSDSQYEFKSLTDILGLYFQIRDDYANICMEEYSSNKTYCEDLTEGKFSFPVIHAIHTRPDDQQVIKIIRQRPKEEAVKKYCVSLLEKFGSIEYTRNVLHQLDELVRTEVENLGGNPFLIKLLDALKNWR